MSQFSESNLQETIQNDIQNLYSELSQIQIDSKILLITVGTLIFTGFFSDLNKTFPGWIPISLIVLIIMSVNQISNDLKRYSLIQYPKKKNPTKFKNLTQKKRIQYALDLRIKFSLIKPTLASLIVIIMLYYLIFCYYFVQQDLNLPHYRTGIFVLSILFIIVMVLLVELIFPSHIIKLCTDNMGKSKIWIKILDKIIERILERGLKITVYLTPFILLYLLVAPSFLTDSLNSPYIFMFIIAQFFFWLVLKDIFVRYELRDLIKRKISWLNTMKKEISEIQMSDQITTEKLHSLFEKYRRLRILHRHMPRPDVREPGQPHKPRAVDPAGYPDRDRIGRQRIGRAGKTGTRGSAGETRKTCEQYGKKEDDDDHRGKYAANDEGAGKVREKNPENPFQATIRDRPPTVTEGVVIRHTGKTAGSVKGFLFLSHRAYCCTGEGQKMRHRGFDSGVIPGVPLGW